MRRTRERSTLKIYLKGNDRVERINETSGVEAAVDQRDDMYSLP